MKQGKCMRTLCCRGYTRAFKRTNATHKDWQCEWCQCTLEQTSEVRKGPSGPITLCNACFWRHRKGSAGRVAAAKAAKAQATDNLK